MKVPPKKCKNPAKRILNNLLRRKCACGAELRSWGIEMEQIEITSDGSFGGKPDYQRKFMPGLTFLTFECARGHTWEEPFTERRST